MNWKSLRLILIICDLQLQLLTRIKCASSEFQGIEVVWNGKEILLLKTLAQWCLKYICLYTQINDPWMKFCFHIKGGGESYFASHALHIILYSLRR